MGDNVTEFRPVSIGAGYKFDADKILTEALGQGFRSVVIIGELEDGELWVSSAVNAGEALILIERAKHQIVFGDSE